eukprot:m.485946 g.485946  ORF g.485946 m.485946 type:complete len:212 (-) comp21740_c0_seq2:2184-2819(-)
MMRVLPRIERTISQLSTTAVCSSRRAVLAPLIDFISAKKSAGEAINLNFICTHNSRRSHLSQAWAQGIGAYYNIPHLLCYSGGTESTAVFPQALAALTTAGFESAVISEGRNPVYGLRFSLKQHPIIAFSKTFEHSFNPQGNFAAILTCNEADKGCPHIAGADERIAVPYNDPKDFDGTPIMADKYIERSLEIATELNYVFSEVASRGQYF